MKGLQEVNINDVLAKLLKNNEIMSHRIEALENELKQLKNKILENELRSFGDNSYQCNENNNEYDNCYGYRTVSKSNLCEMHDVNGNDIRRQLMRKDQEILRKMGIIND